MSMIPAEYSATRSNPVSVALTARRLPRAAGLLTAAALSAGLWLAILSVLRLVF